MVPLSCSRMPFDIPTSPEYLSVVCMRGRTGRQTGWRADERGENAILISRRPVRDGDATHQEITKTKTALVFETLLGRPFNPRLDSVLRIPGQRHSQQA